jgi:hypothetical protein
MKYLFVGLCLLSLVATFRFATQLTRALESQKRTSNAALNRLGGESDSARSEDESASKTPASDPKAATSVPATAVVPTLIPMHPSPSNPTSDKESESVDAASNESSSDPPDANSLLSRMKRSPPVRQKSALHPSMITPGNFEYLGAIRPPHIQQNETTFAYGGWGVAYRADGDPDGPDDGYPGSLFMVGHQNHQKVVEIDIPAPINSKLKLGDDLPVAKILQPFEDATDGLLEEMTGGSSEHFQLGGLLVTGGVLHWTMHKYYNVENNDYASHGTSGLNLAKSIAEGLWHLGPMNSGRPEWNSYKHAGYIFEIPQKEAAQWFGGRNLISGLQISTGLQASSQGPAMFAYSLPPEGTPPNATLDALPLCWYSEQQPVRNHHPADRWIGGAWLSLGDKQAVVIAGRKALGEFYYGEARPQDCTQDKGYHGPPYEVELLFYSPASLIHAANGTMQAHGLEPWLRWDGQSEGGGLNQYMFETCGKQVGGMTYDRERNLLYLVQVDAAKTRDNEFESLPVVHVFRIVD